MRAAWWVPIVLCVSGCKSADERRRECAEAGVVESCEAACNEGVTGKGGCLDLAQQVVKTGDRTRAAKLFARACRGGEIEACRKAWPEVSEAVALGDGGTVRDPTRAALDERTSIAVKMCELGGDCLPALYATAGDGTERAEAAYLRLCPDGAEEVPDQAQTPKLRPRSCGHLRKLVAHVAKARAGCELHDVLACWTLSRTMLAYDPGRAVIDAIPTEYSRRKLARIATLEQFVRQRRAERDDDYQTVWETIDPRWEELLFRVGCGSGFFPYRPKTLELPSWPPRHTYEDLEKVDADTLDRLLSNQKVIEGLTLCRQVAWKCQPLLAGHVTASVGFDGTGHVWKAVRGSDSDVPNAPLVDCMLGQLRKLGGANPGASFKIKVYLEPR